MLNIFKKDIDRQIDRFVKNASLRSQYSANNHREWLLLFKKITGRDNVLKVTEKDVVYYIKYLEEKFNGHFIQEKGINSLKQFLKFYRILDWRDDIKNTL